MKRSTLGLAASILCAGTAAGTSPGPVPGSFTVRRISQGIEASSPDSSTAIKLTPGQILSLKLPGLTNILSVVSSPASNANLNDANKGLVVCLASYAYGPFGGPMTGVTRMTISPDTSKEISSPDNLAAFRQAQKGLEQVGAGQNVMNLSETLARALKACVTIPAAQ